MVSCSVMIRECSDYGSVAVDDGDDGGGGVRGWLGDGQVVVIAVRRVRRKEGLRSSDDGSSCVLWRRASGGDGKGCKVEEWQVI